jgi:CitMHS family citrate-Mg2+:H+ or citrate-Ca2+:H+ symporter
VLVALIVVPIVTGLIGGFGTQIGVFAMDGMRGVTPVAALLSFAVIYFGVMNDVGLFEPVIRTLVRLVGRDPVKITVGTAAIAALAHLDGAGASTFMVTVPAMLPLYQRVGMSPLTLTCATALAAGTMNMLPWGGPTTRAATSLQVNMSDLFLPVVPAMVVGMAAVFVCAVHLGRRERTRLAALTHVVTSEVGQEVSSSALDGSARARLGARWSFNAILTAITLTALFLSVVPLPIVFVAASALALIVNYPDAHQQREKLTGHAAAAMMMVTTIFAAGVFTGILTKSGMLAAMSADLVRVLPTTTLRHFPVVMAVTSMPLSLAFDPDSFYFGLLPILASASHAAGSSAVEVGRAAILGQMTTGFPVSPLTPATFLLVGLAGVDLADHQRRTIAYALGVTLVMAVIALATHAITF